MERSTSDNMKKVIISIVFAGTINYCQAQSLNKEIMPQLPPSLEILKFRKPTNGAVNTAEFDFPDTINASQPWIREAPVGDWFYAPGFTYDSGSMIRFIIEAICRDGNAALNIPMRPDGSIEDACVTMLEEVGKWMDINGEAVYGSKAWRTLGEGEIVEADYRCA